jgi:murein L,D-transpeptidase YafK
MDPNNRYCSMRPGRRFALAAVGLLIVAAVARAGTGDVGGVNGATATWILIDSQSRTLSVMEDRERAVQVFENVAFGRGGVAPFRRSGDGKTPTGEFYVAWINPESRYHLFFGLDYPRPVHAEEAYRERAIDVDTYFTIREAHYRGRVPPQDTALGGEIGIHGIGEHDPDIHRLFNWTMGCVALTDQQIEQLAPWLTLGTRVVIR